MSGGFTKLFSSIVTSSIWREDNVTRIVWVTMLALADARGHVDAAIPGLAAAANVDLDECERALLKLQSPDKYSRTSDNEGRRIVPEEGGWRILNYVKYREKRDPERRREQNREAKRRQRSKQRVDVSRISARVSQSQPESAQAEAEADKPPVVPQGTADALEQEFDQEFWPNVPAKVGKGTARRAYAKARKKASKETILHALPAYRRYEEQRRAQDPVGYRPLHPATWLNGERWSDEVPPATTESKPAPDLPPVERGPDGLTPRERVLRTMEAGT